jgi:hypothetical protein
MECLILKADFGHRDAEPWASHTAVSERWHHATASVSRRRRTVPMAGADEALNPLYRKPG